MIPQMHGGTGHPYGLTVAGVQIVESVPTDLSPIRWTYPTDSDVGSLEFVVEDEGATPLPMGSVVRLTDNTNAATLATGILVGKRERRLAGPGRAVECRVLGWGFYLDHRAVQSYAWAAGANEDDTAIGLFNSVGIMARETEVLSTNTLTTPGSADATTARSAARSITESSGSLARFYVDHDGWAHYWVDPADEAGIVGAATSVGDEGAHVPEDFQREQDETGVAHVALVSDSDAVYRGNAGNASSSSWDAGPVTITYQSDSSWQTGSVLPEASDMLGASYAPLTSITFSTSEVTGWRPYQSITVDDSVLTGSTAEGRYIETVAAEIGASNVIRYHVTVSARTASLVQSILGDTVVSGGGLSPNTLPTFAFCSTTAHQPTIITT